MRIAEIAVLMLLAVPTYAAGTFQLPTLKPFQLNPALGHRPSVTAVPLLQTLDTFRKSDHTIALGGKEWHMAIQTTRDGQWAVSLLEVGKRHREFAWASPWRALKKGLAVDRIGDIDYRSYLENGYVVFAPVEPGLQGGSVVRVPVAALKTAAWDKAIPLPSLGNDWRMVFQVDLFIGAGMRTFTFIRQNGADLEFHSVRTESVARVEPRIKDVGGTLVQLQITDGGKLTVQPAPKKP
jgi:hypothetical protein